MNCQDVELEAMRLAAREARERSRIGRENGYHLRHVSTRFGVLVQVEGTTMAYCTEAQAREYARTLPHRFPPEPPDYDERVRALEDQGLTRSDAQGVVDAEELTKAGAA